MYGDNRDRAFGQCRKAKTNKVFKMSKGEQNLIFCISTQYKHMQIVTMSNNDLGAINICSGKPTN